MEISVTNLIEYLINAIAIASIVANFTPTPKDNIVLAVISKIVNAVALNIKNDPVISDTKKVDPSKLNMLLLLVAMAVSLPMLSADASAAPAQVKLTCDAPTTRVDGTPLAASEIVGYFFFKGGTLLNAVAQTACEYTYTVAAGQCLLRTEQFTVRAIASDGAGGQATSASSNAASPAVDICSPKTAPSAPGGVKVIQF